MNDSAPLCRPSLILLFLAGLTAAVDLGAQHVERSDLNSRTLITCSEGTERTVSGTVVDEAGTPLRDVRVELLDHGCVAASDAEGWYGLAGVPHSSFTLEFVVVGRRALQLNIGEGPQPVTTAVAFGPVQQRRLVTRRFERVNERPGALTAPEGLAGCYWFGAVRQGSVHQFELMPTGDVRPALHEHARATWRMDDDSTSIAVNFTTFAPLWHESARIHVGPDHEWSFLPVEWSYRSDGEPFTERVIETFAVRVPCGGGR